jgi:predicted transcriptional regulator
VLRWELERDVKRVHEDVGVLIECGLAVRAEDGKFNVPYDVVRDEFDLRAVA